MTLMAMQKKELEAYIQTIQNLVPDCEASENAVKRILAEFDELNATVVACMSTFDATVDDLQPKATALERIIKAHHADPSNPWASRRAIIAYVDKVANEENRRKRNNV